nr:hypothetical protein [Raoultibacter phocaeensis]
MGNGLKQGKRALIGEREYRFVELLESVGGDGEVVVCEGVDGVRRYATQESWEAGCLYLEAENKRNPSLVTSASTNTEKLALFRSLFAVRDDVYAKSYFSKKTSRVGYVPACSNEWVSGVCGKPRVKCADCARREFLPLDDAALKRHFVGADQEDFGIVAGYPLIDEDKTCVLAIDFDKAD